MATYLTNSLRALLAENNLDPAAFAAAFGAWKASFPAGEFASFVFGKDAAYIAPLIDGKQNLRHVHLAPQSDPQELLQWTILWRRGSRKVSDRALVYTTDAVQGHLLIYILDEPDAHDIAAMKTDEDKNLMRQFARVAADFVHDGSINA